METMQRQFVSWVEPIAAQLRESRAQAVAFARSVPPEAWSRPSPLPGWTHKDLLAHLAGDTGKGSAATMRAAVARQAPDPTPFAAGVNALNGQDVKERRGRTIAEIVAEIEADGEVWQDLLSRLKETDEEMRWQGFPFGLGEYLRILAPHDREHLAELQTALEAK